MPMLAKKVGDLNDEDLKLVVEAASAPTNMHLSVSEKVWDHWESLSRAEHLKRISDAKKHLTKLFEYFKAK